MNACDLAHSDRCPHCDAVLRDPPDCCEPMRAEYRREWNEQLLESPEPDRERVYLCTVCRKNAVDALNGFDTCAECLARQ